MNIDVKRLKVKYNQRTVGFLKELSNGDIAFQYDKDWLVDGFSISPFSLPLSNQVYVSKSPNFNGLYGVFYDSLPDGWGVLVTRRYLRNKGLDYDRLSPLVKLSLANLNGLGGLSYEPTQAEKKAPNDLDLDMLAKEIKKMLNHSHGFDALDDIYQLGGASGGARPKAHIIMNHEKWIIKFPSSLDPPNMGEMEYQSNILAKKSGIQTNDFHLFESKLCSGYFGSIRFDRKGQKKVHMISLSSLLETSHQIPNLDYSHYFQVVQKICINQEEIYEAFRRMCFNVLYQNKDDHGKNFGFLYDEEIGGYRLSPCYDITQTKRKAEHEMTVLGEGKPKESDLLKIANQFNLSTKRCKDIIGQIKDVLF
jgi:serine/threonine-protein kinase HipA